MRLARLVLPLLVLSAHVASSQEMAQRHGADEGGGNANPHVVIATSLGEIVVELFPDEAPKTVENFLAYVGDGHYDGTLVYRVTSFLIQAGSTNADFSRRQARAPIANEADNGLLNERGKVGMARWGPHTATAEFYVNTRRNPHLDHREKSEGGWGYCVFGRVVQGMATVDAIAAVATGPRHGWRDVPLEDVLIEKVVVAPPDARFEVEDVGEVPPGRDGSGMEPARGKRLKQVG